VSTLLPADRDGRPDPPTGSVDTDGCADTPVPADVRDGRHELVAPRHTVW